MLGSWVRFCVEHGHGALPKNDTSLCIVAVAADAMETTNVGCTLKMVGVVWAPAVIIWIMSKAL